MRVTAISIGFVAELARALSPEPSLPIAHAPKIGRAKATRGHYSLDLARTLSSHCSRSFPSTFSVIAPVSLFFSHDKRCAASIPYSGEH